MFRSIAKISLFITGFFLLLSGTGLAENRQGAVTVTPMVGYHAIDGGMDLDSNAAFGLAVGYNLTKHWALEGDVRYTPTQTDSNGGADTDVDIWTLSAGAFYHFQPEQAFNPYLAFGVGGLVYDADASSSLDEDAMGFWGGGVKYAFNDTTALRLDLRHILDYRSDNRGVLEDENVRWRHHVQAMLGVNFQFGGVGSMPAPKAEPLVAEPAPLAAVVATPVDSDGDGVNDARDKCPGTSAGVRVDLDGCPADTDGDGVADYLDACVDTPQGEKVDSRGCPDDVDPIAELALQLNFGVDKDTVTPFHYRELVKAVEFINNYSGHRVEVEGHTDSTGDAAYNLNLSARRAENVRKVLIEKYGIAADRITARGFGEDKPMGSNDTAAGRLENRRVEIEILP